MDSTKTQAISSIANQLSQLYAPTPTMGTASQFQDENAISSIMSGAGMGLAAATAGFTGGASLAIGAGFAALSWLSNKDKRKKAEEIARKQKEEAWRRALIQHKARVRGIKSDLTGQQKALSEAKVTRLAAAAGQAEVAYDAKISQSIGRGVTNVTQLQSAAAQADNLQAILANQEAILDAKYEALEGIQTTLDKELDAKRGVGTLDTKFYEQARDQIEDYNRRF